MSLLILGLLLFIGTHAFTMARRPRADAIGRFGIGPYKGIYSLLSFLGLALIAAGYGRYRAAGYIPVWDPPVFTRHLALVLVWAAFVMLASAYLPGRIRSTLKHPMLAAVKVWALAHLLANGDLGSIVLFGCLLAWAVAARISVKRRAPGDEGGPRLGAPSPRNDVIAVAVGTAVFLVFALWLHPLLIGVPAWPGAA